MIGNCHCLVMLCIEKGLIGRAKGSHSIREFYWNGLLIRLNGLLLIKLLSAGSRNILLYLSFYSVNYLIDVILLNRSIFVFDFGHAVLHILHVFRGAINVVKHLILLRRNCLLQPLEQLSIIHVGLSLGLTLVQLISFLLFLLIV